VSGQVEQMREENYFFRLSAFTDRLLEWYENTPDNITPEGYRNEALGLLRQGLDDISITRTSLSWGVPVPWDEQHVFYVWYDALINYATAVGFGSDEDGFAAWWPSAHHLIGKDILRFHCVYWPAMLLAAGVEDLPRFHVHGWLLIGGEKMSKSKLNQIAPSDLIADFGVDGFRYAMLRDNPFGPDSDFSYEHLMSRYNSDLANTFGNLLQRVTTVVGSKCDGIGPAPDPDSPLAAIVADAYAATADAWDRVQPAIALEATWRIVRDTNEYLSEREPWKLESGPEVDTIMGDALEALRIATILASPAIPSSAEAAWARIGMSGSVLDQRLPDAARWGGYPGGLTIAKGDPLFPRLKG
jgi:methionyl-tRNA synthetase